MAAVMKVRISVDLVKSVYQVADSVRVGQVIQRKPLNRQVSGDIYRSKRNRSSR